jgi:hypothetical protein
MEPNITPIERAFSLARSGRYLNISEIRDRLRAEGYFIDTIIGPHLSEQLKATIAATLNAGRPEKDRRGRSMPNKRASSGKPQAKCSPNHGI